jgi:hypothetical protein
MLLKLCRSKGEARIPASEDSLALVILPRRASMAFRRGSWLPSPVA